MFSKWHCLFILLVCYKIFHLLSMGSTLSSLSFLEPPSKDERVSKMQLRFRRRLKEPLSPPSLHLGGLSSAALPESSDDAVQSQLLLGQVKSPHRVVVAFLTLRHPRPSESFKAPTGPDSNEIDSAFVVLFHVISKKK